jgi:glycerol kinase
MLPTIRASSGFFAEITKSSLKGLPIFSLLGDQHAALIGQTCFQPGEMKNTYGTGCFLVMNTGTSKVESTCGLLTTMAYQFEGQKPVYALEGSIAVTGSLVQWLRDNLGLIEKSEDIEALARTVEDNGGAYFVPAFSGLYAPYWRDSARGVIAGLTRYVNKGHIARAVLESTAFQTRDVVEAMQQDSGIALRQLRTDGGMVVNDLLMQIQADALNCSVVRPKMRETTALGAAYAAGLGCGFYKDTESLTQEWSVDRTWEPKMEPERRDRQYRQWKKAVARSFDWEES